MVRFANYLVGTGWFILLCEALLTVADRTGLDFGRAEEVLLASALWGQPLWGAALLVFIAASVVAKKFPTRRHGVQIVILIVSHIGLVAAEILMPVRFKRELLSDESLLRSVGSVLTA